MDDEQQDDDALPFDGLPVHRATGHVRLVADSVSVIAQSRDFDLLVLTSDPKLAWRQQKQDGDNLNVKEALKAGWLEVGRVRMTAEVASQMAMTLLLQLLRNQRVDRAEIMDAVSRMVDLAGTSTLENEA